MPVNLVVARCGRSPLLMGEVEGFSDDDTAALLDATSMEGSCALVQVLPGGATAVGRRSGARCAWWVGDDFPVDPPHGLWTEPSLFTAEGDAEVPDSIDVNRLLELLASVDGTARAAKVVAGAVRTLRASEEPLFIQTNASTKAQEALALALVAVLGPDLSVAVGHPAPDPARYRLAIGPEATEGYAVLLASDPPDEGDDLVAWYARDRLRADPGALFVPGGVSEELARQALRDGTLDGPTSAEGRIRALCARLRAGAELDDDLQSELVALTVLTGDARPWEVLQKRPSIVRRRAVEALFPVADRTKPTAALLEALSAVYPKGAPLAPWCVTLLDWTRRTKVPGPFVAALEHAIDAWPQSATRANRVSVWTELVQILVDREKFREAQAAVTGDLARALIREGSGVAVATMWGALPSDWRNPRKIGPMAEQFARHRDGDRAAAQLFRHVSGNPAEVDLLLKAWFPKRGTAGIAEDDALFLAVSRTEHLSDWLGQAMDVHTPAAVLPLLPRVATGPEDPLWLDAESLLAQRTEPAKRFANLGSLSSGIVALEPLARALIDEALREARFPDAALSETARLLSEVPGSASMWPWVAVAASKPGRFADDVVDGTVVALCEHPPTNGVERQVCIRVAELLGAGAEWEPLDHARWLVRVALAPDGDQTGFHDNLIAALVHGLIARFDAGPHVGRLMSEMMQLPPDHEALVGLLTRWLPDAWRGRIPASFVESVESRGVPEPLLPFWHRLVD